uniref:Related to Retrovirus-related POL polyprotein n=1 Tax=Melanopsichium pennsylvanicum 4 TaxID=1398559 RepID=A0A077RCV8_9BASI|nr:related to Retrovirus-related POL polyprotein [Melanopsichium pennsylvanicum 4]
MTSGLKCIPSPAVKSAFQQTSWWFLSTLLAPTRTKDVTLPDSEAAMGQQIRVLRIWSIHVPPTDNERRDFWNSDDPELSHIDSSVRDENTGVMVGADWNTIHAPTLDNPILRPGFAQI